MTETDRDAAFFPVYESLTGDGWLTVDEAFLLWNEAGRTTGDIVEVGCYKGRSSMLLAQTGRILHCVDPWDDSFSSTETGAAVFARFLANIRTTPLGGENVRWYRMKVEEWTPVPAGFVYLDGDHTYEGTVRQIEQALLCRPSGVGIHDVNDRGDGALIKRAALTRLGGWNQRVGRLAVWRLR